ncbi:MAG: hypothetical protein KBF58_00780 [Methyloversatilis sp.]|jgi:hypothetical protein|nr:hypothetical protein [Methyloversatilis sp.]
MHCIDKPCSGFVCRLAVAPDLSTVSGGRPWRTIRNHGDTPVDADRIVACLNPQ